MLLILSLVLGATVLGCALEGFCYNIEQKAKNE